MNQNMDAHKMQVPLNISEIKPDALQYEFTDHEESTAVSIYVFIDRMRGKALILDTAYPEYSFRVKEDLATMGIEPEKVVISHYHPDHCSGSAVFQGCDIYAGEFYENNFFNSQRWAPQYKLISPNHLIKDGMVMTFGSFQFSFIHAPGHCECMLMTLVDHQMLHTADLVMFTRDKKICLPYVALGGSFKEHINSLERIKTINPIALLLPHGGMISGVENIVEQVDDRIYYLKRVLGSTGTLPVAACLKKDISNYSNIQFHDNNLVQLSVEI